MNIRECFLSFDKEIGSKIINLNLAKYKRKNAFGKTMLKDMNECLDWILGNNADIKVMIIKSELIGCFSSGADLKERLQMTDDDEVKSFVDDLRNTFTKIENLAFPTISAIDGIAFGGGLELSLCSDIRIASQGKDEMFSMPECQLGVIPGAGGTQRLTKLIGPMMAKYLIFTSKAISSKRAFEIGLISDLIPQNDNGNAAYLEALKIAKKIADAAPLAIIAAKKAINSSIYENKFHFERALYNEIIQTKDRKEGLVSFKEKRKPKYTGK